MIKSYRWSLKGTFTFLVALTLLSGVMVFGQHTRRRKVPAATVATKQFPLTDRALVQRYRRMITPESLAARLYFLASDLFEGRETATRGQKLAAQYLASQYQQLGLTPKSTAKVEDPLSPSAYLQPFTVYKRSPKQSQLEVRVNGSKAASSTFSSESHDDLSYFSGGGLVDASGAVIFAGYGIADDKLGYNDYAALAAKGISLADKWVLILEDEPLADGSTSLLPTSDHKPSSWTTQFINKRRALWNAGRPKGVLVVADAAPGATSTFRDRAALAALNTQRVGYLSLIPSSPFPSTYAISTTLANQILASSGHTVADLKREIDRSLKPTVFALNDDVKVTATVESFPGLTTENVLAFIEGSDPRLKNEVVIVSAHYDHLGIDSALKGDQIFNGAADDGSGVAATLALAQEFMKARREGFGPRRSILFINFTGEEKGLLGSDHYAMHQPVVPWEKVVAEINMDGVGGLDPNHPTHSRNYVYTLGTEALSRELIETTKRINRSMEINLELTEGKRFHSDDYNFETQLVPYIYFSTGYTDHYHRVSDEAASIDYDHLTRVVQLVFATTWQVANQNTRPAGVDRTQLRLVGYVCPPCPFECDEHVYNQPGECPVCRMSLAPKYTVEKRRASVITASAPR
ncbi:MAG TPA: M28 family peptidase [Pyrinomonadaceae bacterium]